MTRICLYEYFTSGGLWGEGFSAGLCSGIRENSGPNSPPRPDFSRSQLRAGAQSGLAAEGRVLASALAADFAAIEGTEIVCLRDVRLSDWRPSACRMVDVGDAHGEVELLVELAATSDWTLVIAPETGGALTERCRRVVAGGGRLLGPSPSLVAMASDKQRTALHLAAAGVPVPRGVEHRAGEPWPRGFCYPAVWKPLDGAGSEMVELVSGPDSSIAAPADCLGRLEAFQPGMPASVSFLCGSNRRVALPPCSQRVSSDGRFRYLGGATPLPAPLAARAVRIAERAVAALDGAFGYLGVDLILGARSDGGDDCVIEVNPRLTTSYVGLRAACQQNLAHGMLRLALGVDESSLTFRAEQLTFSSKG